MINRRELLAVTGSLALGGRAAAQQDAWAEASRILERIKAPTFPKKDFDITRYGAVAGEQKDCTAAIAQAIAECNKGGGGRVVVPAGVFATAAIHLKSNVNLHLMQGATLRFVRDPKRYLPLVYTRWEGTECMNYSPFIYADGQENIAVTGEGTLDGNCDAQNWWNWAMKGPGGQMQAAARNRLNEMGERDVPVAERVFGEGSYLRPSFVQACRSRNVLIEGVTIVNSPMWEVTPLLCTNVIVRGVKVSSHGPNNDGCDPDSCRDVLIEDCVFDTGDDCIAIKSGRNRDGRRKAAPTENVIIRNCQMKDGHGGVTIGSEMSGGVRNVFVENCKLSSPHLNQALRFKTNAMRGGAIENVYFRGIEIGEIADAVLQVDFNYEEGSKGPERPVVRNIELRDVKCRKAKYAWNLKGFADAPIRDVRMERCRFEAIEKANVAENVVGLEMKQVTVGGKAV